MNKILVIVGMCGVGKSVTCDYLETKGYNRVYFGEVTFEKMQEAGMEITPDNEKLMREKLRKEGGMGIYATLNLPKIKEALLKGDVIVESLYSWEELKIVSEEFKSMIKVIAIVADKSVRYKRLSVRPVRSFSESDAIKRDISEIENSFKAGPIAYADYFIDNNGTILDLHKKIDEVIEKIK